ncbi:MAG: putative dehydrogenase [Arcticibacterium sp.]|jgi:predicted dehydrogenase
MLKGVCVGAGYFSRFQYEAWNRIPEVEITALCNRNEKKGKALAVDFGIKTVYTDVAKMLDTEQPDFIDIITPPETHLAFCREAFKRKMDVVVQKPLAPTMAEAKTIVEEAATAGVRLMVHENFRFQPWYREIKKLLTKNAIGENIFSAYFRMRMGDGWGEEAYLNRQPYFREMPQLLVYETGVHFIDTFRYLFGDVEHVYARLRKLNSVIKGEDAALVQLDFSNGIMVTWDANRYNESDNPDSRYTFGEMVIEGNEGSIRLFSDGEITIQRLGEAQIEHPYEHHNVNFAGDCVYFTQRHFVDCMLHNLPFETSGEDYLTNIKVQDLVYRSHKEKQVLAVKRG